MSHLIKEVKVPHPKVPPRPTRLLSVVTLGGLVITGFCLCLLYLLDAQSLHDGNAGPAVPVHPAVTSSGTHADQPKEQDDFNAILLHPEYHAYRAPKTIRLTWNITLEPRSPDGVLKHIYLINGQFPGPVVETRSGDELIVSVYNAIHDHDHPGISIHWHGLSMQDANEMDGVVGLTQCAIRANQTFTYQFRIPDHQHGTFWYHAHSSLQRADGLYGGLIVHRPVQRAEDGDQSLYDYKKEQLLLIGDWYHRKAEEVLEWFVDPDHYGLEPSPDSLLLNGRGRFNCSMAVKTFPVQCKEVVNPAVRLVQEERIRLRVINTGVSAGFGMLISNGAMKLITVDGGYPVSNTTASAGGIGLLYPGERIDVLLDRALGHGMSPNLTIELDRENMRLWNFALTRTQSFEIQPLGNPQHNERRHGSPIEPSVDIINLADITGQPVLAQVGIGQRPTQQAVLYSTMRIRGANHNHPVGSINYTSWITPDPKSYPLLSLEREQWAALVPQPTKVHKFDVPWFRESGKDEWVDVVVNNFDDKGHPFHLHGNEFFLVARSTATAATTYRGYNPFDTKSVAAGAPLNTHNPLRRDTVYIPPMGYVVMRFPLRNDGLWLLHCHVLWHQAIGMGTVLQVGEISDSMKLRARKTCS